MNRSKPYMGSGPEIEEPEEFEDGSEIIVNAAEHKDRSELMVKASVVIGCLREQIAELEGAEAAYQAQARNQEMQFTDLTDKFMKLNLAFARLNELYASHMADCTSDDEEPREKRCL